MAGVQGNLSMPPEPQPVQQPVQEAAVGQGAGAAAGLAPSGTGPPQPDYSQSDALLKGMGSPLAQTNSMLAQNRAALAPQQAATQKAAQAYQQAASNTPPQPGQAAPEPQQGIGLQAAGEWVAVASVLGAVAGAMTRRSTTNALAAFTGALEGMQAGNRQAFEQNKVIWEQENKRINQQLQQQQEAYMNILNSKKTDFNTQMLLLQQEATRQHDDVMAQLAGQQKQIEIAKLIDIRERERTKGVAAYEKAQKVIGGGAQQRRLDDAAIDAKVEQMKQGFPSVEITRGLGREDIAEINNRFAKSGGDAGKVMEGRQNYTRGQSEARAGGTMEQRSNAATEEMKAAIPLALESSRNLPRGQFVPINQLVQMGQQATSNPQYNDFLVKNQTLAKAYGRAMNPQGIPRVSENAEAKAEGILSKATSQQAYEVQARALWQEAENVQAAIKRTRPGSEPMQSPFGAGAGAAGGAQSGGQQFTGRTATNKQTGQTLRETSSGDWVP